MIDKKNVCYCIKHMMIVMLLACVLLSIKDTTIDVNAASDGSLEVTSFPVAYTPEGSYIDLAVKVKNKTARAVTGVSIIDSTEITNPKGKLWTPYEFQYSHHSEKCPEPVNATKDDKGYTIAAGKTATFYIRVFNNPGRGIGTYTDYVQFGRKVIDLVYDYDPEEGVTRVYYKTTIEAEFTDRISVKNIVYEPTNTKLTLGTSTNHGVDITPFGSVIDFGTINLATAGSGTLKQTKLFYGKNTSPTGNDEHGNNRNIKVEMDINTNEDSRYEDFCFDFDDNLMSGMKWDALEPATESSFSTIDGTLILDATEYIAGTYNTNLMIKTIPYGVSVNGSKTNTEGMHTIPVKVTLTGVNPRLPARVNGVVAQPGNNQVELTWTAPKEGLDYRIFRREGTETATDPDKWTISNWDKYEELNVYRIEAKSDGSYIFVDGTAENGKTYTYTLIAGEPFKGYASKPVSATPKSSYISRLQCPEDIYGNEMVGGVELEWEMNENYGGSSSNGESMVDHFNVYRDNVLVAQVSQNAVQDECYFGQIEDDEGNYTYGVKSHDYYWKVFIETPVLIKDYTFSVSAVSKSGLEGYMSERILCKGFSDAPIIVSHSAYTSSVYLDDDKEIYKPAISASFKYEAYGDNIDYMTVWRKEGTGAPNTSSQPYKPAEIDETTFYDSDVTKGKTYTYTVRITDILGNHSNFYTFTVIVDYNKTYASPDATYKVVDGNTVEIGFYGDEYYDNDLDKTVYYGTCKLYRNGTLLKTFSGKDYYTYEDTLTADGRYTYRVDKIVDGMTIRDREYIYDRDTSIVDDSLFTKTPGTPNLQARISDGKIVLTWTKSSKGGEPEGYHIYRKDNGKYVEGERDIQKASHYPVVRVGWGLKRYLTITDSETDSFVDYSSFGCYKNDSFSGYLTTVDWEKDKCPHEYWITAYNSAGESEPSQLFTFEYNGENIPPENEEITPPGKPVITKTWVEWEDDSQGSDCWDDMIDGYVKTSWKDTELGGGIDYWNIYSAGNHESYDDDMPDKVYYSDYVSDKSLKTGNALTLRSCISAGYGQYYDYGRTITTRVGAVNSEGETLSDPAQTIVYSLPCFRTFSENSAVKLEWTDLLNDPETVVTKWQLMRKKGNEAWQLLETIDADKIEYSSEDRYGVKGYMYRDQTAENGQNYQYKVVAVCADGIDRPSVIRNAKPDPLGASERSGKPLNLKAEVLHGEILLTWNPPTTGGKPRYYHIEEKNIYGDEEYWSGAGEISANTCSFVYVPYQAKTYTFRVYGYNYTNYDQEYERTALEGELSDEVTINITNAMINDQATESPGEPIVSAVSGDRSITLNWTYDKSTGSAPTYYLVERVDPISLDSSEFIAVTVSGKGSSFTYTDNTAIPGIRYRYDITAYNYSGSRWSCVFATAGGKTDDEKAADYVVNLIDDLPEPNEVTKEDAESINSAEECYNSLTSAQKKYVSDASKNKLDDCVAKLEYIEINERYGEIAAGVQNLIDALPDPKDVTSSDEEKIREARVAYESLYPIEIKKIVDITRLTDCERSLRAFRYSVADHGRLTVSGKWVIGTEERPEIKAYMYDQEMSVDEYRIGYVLEGDGVVQSAVFSSGNYRIVLIGKDPYYGRMIGDQILKVYDINDILDNAVFSGSNEYEYTGKSIDLTIKVNVNGKWLKSNTDYQIVEYNRINSDGSVTKIDASGLVNKGKYYVILQASEGGFYTGSCRYDFSIVDAPKPDPDAPADDPSKSDPSKTDPKAGLGEDGTPVGKGASAEVAEKAIISSLSDEGPAGTRFAPLLFKTSKQTKGSVKLSWKKLGNAKKYVLYGNVIGKKNKMVRICSVNSTSITLNKINGKKLKKGTYYKFIIVALDKDSKVVSTSKTVYAATLGGKFCNVKKVTTKAKKDKVKIKQKKTFKLGAKAVKTSKKLKLKTCRKVCYESTNPAVATVNKKGVIKGVKKGSCIIYVYSQSGIMKKIKVTVK
ncbi:MAG: fibronectin type III domain-containing protein [Eubacterium sp.]|nr:fibronectin type III domain-containing protein [Eubacterium sp.]